MSPVRFFQQVERIGMLCAVDAGPGAAPQAPEAARLCGLAAEELAALLGAGGPPVLALAVNDERLADPGLLAVLLHAHTRAASEGEPGAGGSVTALAVSLYRSRVGGDAPPFFLAPPEAVVAPAGTTPPEEAMRAALRRLLLSGVARPVLAHRR
ncbi:hypothetical protein [Azospirillum sp. TSO22-1]|uniref:hypothetical protein n=1 Tax=Azospirillum sp. TSO22-1 TaxID=716789 RepID=UPI00130497B3|nr:hypothetical protein [Azospirillum sp. TSO22-1]